MGHGGKKLTEDMVMMRTKCDRFDLIKNLNVWGNDLVDVSVLRRMPNLRVLSMPVNKIRTLSDLAHCPLLSELYLRKNSVTDLAEVRNLQALQGLEVLWLSENPVASLPYYRPYILQHLPNLRKIDSQDVTDQERREALEMDLDGLPTVVSCGHMMMDLEDAQSEAGSDARPPPGAAPPLERRHSYDSPESKQQQLLRQQMLERRNSWSPTSETPTSWSREQQQPSFEEEMEAAFHPRPRLVANEPNSFPAQSPPSAPRRRNEADERPLGGSPQKRSSYEAMQRSPRNSSGGSPQDGPSNYPVYSTGVNERGPMMIHGGSPPVAARGSPGGDQEGRSPGMVPSRWRPPAAQAPAPQAPPALNGYAAASKMDNILCAVLALVKELDPQGLELARRAIEERLTT